MSLRRGVMDGENRQNFVFVRQRNTATVSKERGITKNNTSWFLIAKEYFDFQTATVQHSTAHQLPGGEDQLCI